MACDCRTHVSELNTCPSTLPASPRFVCQALPTEKGIWICILDTRFETVCWALRKNSRATWLQSHPISLPRLNEVLNPSSQALTC